MASDSYSPHPEFLLSNITPPPHVWQLDAAAPHTLLWEYGLTATSACFSDTHLNRPEGNTPLVKLVPLQREAEVMHNLVRVWVEVLFSIVKLDRNTGFGGS